MRDRHRGVFVEQQLHQRTADQVGAADDDGVHAFERGVHAFGQDDAAERRAGRQRGKAAGEASGIVRMQPVDVLGGIDGIDDGFGIKRFRQRQLHQNAVHGRIAIERSDQRQQIALRDVGRQYSARTTPCRLPGSACACCGHRPGWRGRCRPAPPRARASGRCSPLTRATSSATRARSSAAMTFPSMIRAVISILYSVIHGRLRRSEVLATLSPSFVGSPSTAICLRREVVPDRIRTLALGTPSALASSSVTARLASPPSAMARTRTLTTLRGHRRASRARRCRRGRRAALPAARRLMPCGGITPRIHRHPLACDQNTAG